MYDSYDLPPELQGSGGPSLTWADLVSHWQLIEIDFQEIYGIDLASKAMDQRSWRWLRIRIFGLLSTECRTQRALNPQDESSESG